MIRAAALVAGDGAKLQAVLDAIYFQEIPNFELVAVIAPDKQTNALKRAASSRIPVSVVDPELFPTAASHSMAVANKLKDMDVELVILAGYDRELGMIAYQFKNRIIGTYPSLIPAFGDLKEEEVFRAVLERGVKVTGATAYFADRTGAIGGIILQKPVSVLPEDSPESLRTRVLEDAEWKLLTEAISLYCSGRLSVRGSRVVIETKE